MTETDQFERILVTSALPYANGPIHIGHLAGAYLPADIYCRYQRLRGRDVLFISGSDEHGVPIMLRARAEGVEPQVIVDRYHAMIESAFRGFGMTFDHYGRTSAPIHHETSQDFFRALAQNGKFVTRSESQFYDPEAKMFLADRFIRGTCPACGYEDAYGDQCEKCGRSLSPKELINPRSAVTNAVPELRESTHWYFPLGDYQPWLEEWVASHPEWKTNVVGQVRSWFGDGLSDRAMTRDLPWGVSVPSDVAEAANVDATGKKLYVWFDAPIGYISATREWAIERGQPELWKTYWQDPKTKLVHFIGKDNIVFHCIIFPAMLKAHGDYVLPDNVPAHEFLNIEGKKLSTSRNWAVWLHEFLEELPADYLRYALLKTLPETRDADFSWSDFQAHINNELADTVGNFVNRSLTFAERYFENVVPPLRDPSDADRSCLDALADFADRIGDHIEHYRFREAGAEAMALGRMANKYFNDAEPWATRKTNVSVCANTIHVSTQICAALSVLLEPFLPFSGVKMRGMLNLPESIRWEEAKSPLLAPGHALGKSEILFAKLPDEAIERQLERLGRRDDTATAGPPFAPLASTITYEDFAKIDLRVGVVREAERVKKSRKLIRCQVDVGFETRQILAGVAEHLAPEDLIGKSVVLVANLAPRKMMGTESQGMLLMAENREGKLMPVSADSESGSTVK